MYDMYVCMYLPNKDGICLSNSPHLCERATRSPVSGSNVRKTPSSCLKVALILRCVTSMLRTTTMVWPARDVKRSLILALTVVWPILLGSCTNELPDLDPGGNAPGMANLIASMTVVLVGVVVVVVDVV